MVIYFCIALLQVYVDFYIVNINLAVVYIHYTVMIFVSSFLIS